MTKSKTYDELLRWKSTLTIDFYSYDPNVIMNMLSTIESMCVNPINKIDGFGYKFTFTAQITDPKQTTSEEVDKIIGGIL